MIEKNFEKNNENCIEWLSGERNCLCTFTNRKQINRVKNLYADQDHKDDFSYFHENPDGSVCCKIPLKWIKINPGSKREYSDEQRAEMAERMRKIRKDAASTDN